MRFILHVEKMVSGLMPLLISTMFIYWLLNKSASFFFNCYDFFFVFEGDVIIFWEPIICKKGFSKVPKFLICCYMFFSNHIKILFCAFSLQSNRFVSLFSVSVFCMFSEKRFSDILFFNLILVWIALRNSLFPKEAWFSLIVSFFKGACLLTASKDEFGNKL